MNAGKQTSSGLVVAGKFSRDGGAPSRANQLATRLLIAVIALAPLPFGSDFAEAVAFWCLCLALAAGLCRTEMLSAAQANIIFAISLLLGIYAAAVVLQMSSLPSLVAPDPIWAKAANLLGPLRPAIEIARYGSLYGFGPVLANVLALSLGVAPGADRQRARQILLAFAWSGLAYAIFGLVSALIEPGMILWRERPAYFGKVIATFINRNTAATYFGSCGAVWLLIFCEHARQQLGSNPLTWTNLSQRILSRARADTIVSLTGFFICLMALVMTNSRAGVIVSFTGMLGAGAIYFRHDLPKRSARLKFTLGALCGVILAIQSIGGSLDRHFDIAGLSGEGRLQTYQSTLHIILQHPWLGTGLGSFALAFPQYRSPQASIVGIWDMAHSTPLQIAAEMGLPVALIVAAAWGAALLILARGVRIRQRDAILPLSGAAVALIGLAHSCVDFSLQIPGYSIVAMGIVGVGLAQSFRTAPAG